jgi:HEAT repeat protein
LNDAAVEVRSEAALELGSLGVMCPETQPDAASILSGLLAGRDDARVRNRAAWGMALFGSDSRRHPPGSGPDVVPALVAALRDAEADVRREAAHILGLDTVDNTGRISKWEQRKASILPALEAALSDEDQAVREESALALFAMGRRDHGVIELIEQDAGSVGDQSRKSRSESAREQWRKESSEKSPDIEFPDP